MAPYQPVSLTCWLSLLCDVSTLCLGVGFIPAGQLDSGGQEPPKWRIAHPQLKRHPYGNHKMAGVEGWAPPQRTNKSKTEEGWFFKNKLFHMNCPAPIKTKEKGNQVPEDQGWLHLFPSSKGKISLAPQMVKNLHLHSGLLKLTFHLHLFLSLPWHLYTFQVQKYWVWILFYHSKLLNKQNADQEQYFHQ